jgi:hypothetical protein
MEGVRRNGSLADLPPSPFLAAGEGLDGVPPMGELSQTSSTPQASGGSERAPTAREEIRRRLNRVAEFGSN